jgi:transcriptional regulator with XRE-family HTH domain
MRRRISSDISALLVEYVLKESGLTQEQLAEALEVSAAFISRVRGKERSFTVDHLEAVEALMKVPLGAILLAAVPIPKPRRGLEKLQALALQAISQGDIAARAISNRQTKVMP